MNILINASILRVGGSVQVGDSIIRELPRYPRHHFVIVYGNPALKEAADYAAAFPNCEVVSYSMPKFYAGIVTGRNGFLDGLVREKGIEAVLTIFGPARWRPRVFHLCGFARPHLVVRDSPYKETLSFPSRVLDSLLYRVIKVLFQRSCDAIYTENPAISEGLRGMLHDIDIYTVTGSYNQVYAHPESWDKSKVLPPFTGVTVLTIAANFPHKNLKIIPPTIDYLRENHAGFNCRFVLSLNDGDLGKLSETQKEHIVFVGSLKISQCPYLYEQSDIMLLPSLMESFSACYPDAMVMRTPVITTDLSFARGSCGEAAVYYDALSPEALGEAIYRVANDPALRQRLVDAGERQLGHFDDFRQRVEKLIAILEAQHEDKSGR